MDDGTVGGFEEEEEDRVESDLDDKVSGRGKGI